MQLTLINKSGSLYYRIISEQILQCDDDDDCHNGSNILLVLIVTLIKLYTYMLAYMIILTKVDYLYNTCG